MLHPQNSQNPTISASFNEDFEVDIRGLFMMIWRRKILVLSVVFIGCLIAALFIKSVQEHYSARTMVLLEAPGASSDVAREIYALAPNLQVDTSLILGEVEVLRSRGLAEKVVQRLNLLSDPEFNPRFEGKSSLFDTLTQVDSVQSFKNLNLKPEETPNISRDILEQDLNGVVTNFLRNLRVRVVPGSFVMQVNFTSTSPRKAAMIANTVADAYIEQRLEEKFTAAKKVTDWLDKRLSSLRNQVRESEQAVERYRAENDLAEGIRGSFSAEQLSAMTNKLASAKAEEAEAIARLEQAKDFSKSSSKINSTSEVIASRLIQNLKHDESRLESQRSELATRYGPKHPVILNLDSELSKLRRTISEETRNIAKSVENEVSIAKARVVSLQESISEVSGQQNVNNDAMIRLRELQREAQSNQLIFDTFLETYKKADDQEELQDSEVRILSYAVPPRAPSYPNKVLLMSLSAAISLFLALALSLILEKMDNTFRSAGQLEKLANLPCYALIPLLEAMSRKAAGGYILKNPASTVAEAVRTLRMVVNLRAKTKGEKPKVITVTSSLPNEGKTTLSTWLGRLAAKSGERVIIIDCDLRRPSVHRSMGHSADDSLVDFLTGKKDLEEVVNKDEDSGVHVIYADAVPSSALDLVSSGKMEKLVASLRQVYDLVILDTPACLAVSDARVLANLSDQTLYAVQWDKTPREVVLSGIKQFSDAGLDSMALVLTSVDVKRHMKYGYGDAVYYYGQDDKKKHS
jgi:succinoglycan biosynthesis transport protein ExoP